MKKDRIVVFDFIRVVAFFMVVTAHVFQKFHHPLGSFYGIKGFYFVTLGGLAVSIFIILSGISLHYTYANKINIWDFYKKRLMRIYVPYWIAILLVIFLLGLKVIQDSSPLGLLLDFSGLLTLTGAGWGRYVLPTGWFVGVILVLYLFYPLLRLLFARIGRNRALIILLIISVVARLAVGRYYPKTRMLDWLPLSRVFEFGLGMWLIESKKFITWAKKIDFHRWTPLVIYLSTLSYPAYLIHILFTYYNFGTVASGSLWLYWLRVVALTVIFSSFIVSLERAIYKIWSPKDRLAR